MNNNYVALWTAIIAAIIAGVFAIGNNVYTSAKNFDLEKQQFESNLVLKLIVPEDTVQTIQNIKFFIDAGFLSKDNEKLFSLIKKYNIKLPKKEAVQISPINRYETQLFNLFSAQITDEKGNPLENVYIKVFKNRKFQNDTTAFSYTTTDKNGLFKISLPDEKKVKVLMRKKNYKEEIKVFSKNQLKNLNKVILDKN